MPTEQLYFNRRFMWSLPTVDQQLHRDPAMDRFTWLTMLNDTRRSMTTDPSLNFDRYELIFVSERKNPDDTELTVNCKLKGIGAKDPILAMVQFVYHRNVWLMRTPGKPIVVKFLFPAGVLGDGEDIPALMKLANGTWTSEHWSEWYRQVS